MKHVLITGAGSGLGLELAREHLERNYTVFALDVDISDRLHALAAEHPESVLAIQCDIGSTESVERAMEQVRIRTDSLARVFNNAGIHRFKDWVALDETELDFLPEMYNINAVGALRVVKAALPLLGKDTVIVNTSSEAASLTDQTSVIGYAYAMSKAGMNMGARIMDNWLSDRGVRTIMIHPGRMRTGMGGAHSTMDPWETSACVMALLERLDEIPREQKFMNFRGEPMNW